MTAIPAASPHTDRATVFGILVSKGSSKNQRHSDFGYCFAPSHEP